MTAPTGWLRVDELPEGWRVVDTSGTVRPLTFAGPAASHLADVCAMALNAAAEAGGPSALIDARERWLPVVTCPATMPMNWTTSTTYACVLPAGHTGYHRDHGGVTPAGVLHQGAVWPEETER